MWRLSHWYVFIYKAILGNLPCYLSLHMSRKRVPDGLWSQDVVLMSVAEARTELGKKAFKVFAPSSWNNLQKQLKLQDLVTLSEFKTVVKSLMSDSIGKCKCFSQWSKCIITIALSIELVLCLVFYVATVYCCPSWPGLSCKRDFNLNETQPC